MIYYTNRWRIAEFDLQATEAGVESGVVGMESAGEAGGVVVAEQIGEVRRCHVFSFEVAHF